MLQLGDRLHLLLQAVEIDAALLERGRRRDELRLRRPAHLSLDLADERLDARGGTDRLFVLEGEQRGAVLLVAEPQLDAAAREQGAADERDEHDDVLEEETAAGDHTETAGRGATGVTRLR
ncbi:MAG: hypothetical protein HYU41_26410 [Candidatus Rokubacteria bacterium]|nr:hypothetical protein [Candidatus Rokubacteria bacterium]